MNKLKGIIQNESKIKGIIHEQKAIQVSVSSGARGKSAYEIWIEKGNVGTEQDFIISLRGKDGKDGINGTNGLDGINGKDGANGLDGKDGKGLDYTTMTPEEISSITGAQGEKGIQGERGLTGLTGKQGEQGERGLTGLNGVDGINGIDGDKGDSFVYTDFTPEQLLSLKGDKGDKGDKGIKGDTGLTGKDGIDGKDGKDAVGGGIELANHIDNKVHLGEAHGIRLNVDKELEYFDGLDWVVVGIKDEGYPVEPPTLVEAIAGNASISIRWTDPEDLLQGADTVAKWQSTKVMRKVGSYPLHELDGELVVENGVRNQYKTTPYIDEGLTNDMEYFYSFFSITDKGAVTISDTARASAIPSGQETYGIEIDVSNGNSKTRVTYTDEAIDFIPCSGGDGAFSWGSWENTFLGRNIKPCLLKNGVVNYYLDKNDYAKKENGTVSNITNGNDGDVMIEIDEIHYSWTRTAQKHKIKISNKPFPTSVKLAHEVEQGYNQVTYYSLLLLRILFTVLFKSTNSQNALGMGAVSTISSAIKYTGGTNNKGMMYGNQNMDDQMKFLGIEDFWGNTAQWVEGLLIDPNHNYLISNSNFNNAGTGYTSYSSKFTSDTFLYPSDIEGGNELGFLPLNKTGGSTTTFFGDYVGIRKDTVLYFGGHYVDTVSAGYTCTLPTSNTNLNKLFGTRLTYRGENGKLYIGAYLGTELGGKLRSLSGYAPVTEKTIGQHRDLARANNV